MKFKSAIFTFALALCSLTTAAQTENYIETHERPYSVQSVFDGTTSACTFANHFTITPPKGYVLIDAEMSKVFLTDILNNPESLAEGVMACIIPDVDDMFQEDIPFFFVVSKSKCGHIKEVDLSSINYNDILSQMQNNEKEETDKFREENPLYPEFRLIGWAEEPYYDKEAHTLYWAKLLESKNKSQIRTIIYDMRVLGKEGYVQIKAFGKERDLAKIKEAAQDVLANAKFDFGYTYNDFDERYDQSAELTIGSLIAGSELTSGGLWASLAKSWDLIPISLVGACAFIMLFIFKNSLSKDEDLQETGSLNGTV